MHVVKSFGNSPPAAFFVTMESIMIAVNLDRVTVTYVSEPIFENLSWGIHDDRVVGLVGPNGCGKSTLLRLILGELSSDTECYVRWGVHPADTRRYCRHRPHLAEFQLATIAPYPGFHPLPLRTVHEVFPHTALPCSPCGANISTLQACPELAKGIHFMSRAVILHSFLRRIHRFTILAQGSTTDHPEALVSAACYAAA